MPGEDLTHGPPANEKAGGSHHRSGRSTGIPCAMGLTFIRDLPGVRLIATVVSGIIITHRLGASFGAPGPRDFTSATCRSPARCESTLRQDRGHRIPSSTFVTIAKRPSHEDGMHRVFLIFGIRASKISLASAVEVIPLTSQRLMTFTRSCADHRAATRRRTPSRAYLCTIRSSSSKFAASEPTGMRTLRWGVCLP